MSGPITPTPTPPPTNPPWVRIAVISLVLLIWVLTVVNVIMGDDWRESVMWAVIGTICLSAVDIGRSYTRRGG